MVLYKKEDSAEAFGELYGRYAERLMGYFMKKMQQRQDAQVVFQETFLKMHAARGHYNPKFPFAPWLFTIAYHALVDFKRRQQIPGPSSAVALDLVAEGLPVEVPEIPEHALAQLSNDQRTAVSMRFLDEKTFSEISKSLGRSQGDVRQLVSRGLRRLRKILGGAAS